jgi:hypothetical protein
VSGCSIRRGSALGAHDQSQPHFCKSRKCDGVASRMSPDIFDTFSPFGYAPSVGRFQIEEVIDEILPKEETLEATWSRLNVMKKEYQGSLFPNRLNQLSEISDDTCSIVKMQWLGRAFLSYQAISDGDAVIRRTPSDASGMSLLAHRENARGHTSRSDWRMAGKCRWTIALPYRLGEFGLVVNDERLTVYTLFV